MKLLKKITALTALLTLILTSSAFAANDVSEYDVQIIKGSNINLVSQESRVPILVKNNYNTEVRILIHVGASNLRVRLPKTTSITVPANSTVNATVPVQAVANGEVTLFVWLTSFSGVRLGGNENIELRILGDYEAIAIGSLAAVVSLLVVVGVVRTLRRKKVRE